MRAASGFAAATVGALPGGGGFTVLKWFMNSWLEGGGPFAGVTLSDSVLYGTTYFGGSSNYGTIFKLNTDGTDYAVLKDFSAGDGAGPSTGLVVSGGTLYGYGYGTTAGGGTSYDPTVFRMNTDGTGYTVLKLGVGTEPSGVLTFSNSMLYGTTRRGGSLGLGSVFKLELSTPCSLNAQSLGSAIMLSWSNPAYDLQAAPTVTGTYTNIHGATSPHTNAIFGPQKFFRLVGSW